MISILAAVLGLAVYIVWGLVRRRQSRKDHVKLAEHGSTVDRGSTSHRREEKKCPAMHTFPDLNLAAHPQDPSAIEQMKKDKALYHKLQNLEDHPDAITQAEERLLQLLDLTMSEAQASPANTILSIPSYDPQAVRDLLDSAHQATMAKYEAYVRRRRAKEPRELFKDAEYAKEWLKYASCVKYVDGGWIGSIINSLPASSRTPTDKDTSLERQCGKIAWQVISEEFGDGDLLKNHVYLYETMIASLGLGRHDTATAHLGFNHAFDGTAPDEGIPNCWTAAIVQQSIGLLASPEDYFAEAMGFNMAYETMAYHLLITSFELRELKMDDYYFNIHITIDNPTTGHSAMARVAVERYMEGVRERDGEAAAAQTWKRIQAGFILAEGLPTTPSKPRNVPIDESPIVPTPLSVSQPTAAFASLIVNKAASSNKIHCASRLLLGGKTVDEWLDTENGPIPFQRALEMANVLSEKHGWVERGRPEDSRLVRELEWGGRMFGAFSRSEVEIVRSWIKSLKPEMDAKGSYLRHIAANPVPSPPSPPPPYSTSSLDTSSPLLPSLSLWFLSLTLLDCFQLSPSRFASPLGMIVLRIQRAQLGFVALHLPQDVCEGNDETQMVGFETGLWEIGCKVWRGITGRPVSRDIRSMIEIGGTIPISKVEPILQMRCSPYASSSVLLGLVEGLAALFAASKVYETIEEEDRATLNRILQDQTTALEDWKRDAATEEDLKDWAEGRRMGLDLVSLV